ncbi:hypothetical protein GH5_05110 [Leishmania sp. Ghana 2012 LV757]|uniref:hypothetical protein n=1 Tax=Leishmania sp. Ghana 2012 LV757 TaxID=2803181 RepID=UPI001B72E605|nr:hypothetical protein GH5_05110 [Leishmania sp. Ghana 2012 LV757]
MEYFYRTNAAELTPLKTELMDVVSSCLMKEPPFEAAQPGQLTATTAPAAHSKMTDEAMINAALTAPPSPANDDVSTVAQIRELVHLISRHDGEFVLKLALYARHELHLRRSPSFLVALCAREPNCVPFLQPYMEKIIVLPSDWLAVANFAYFHDCDAAHNYAETLTYPTKTGRRECATAPAASRHRERSSATTAVDGRQSQSPGRSSYSTEGLSPAPSAVEARGSRSVGFPGASPSCSGTGTKAKGDRPQCAADLDPTRAYIPAALRTALVATFANFSLFSMAKYDNRAAEHRAQRRQVRRDRAAAAAGRNTSGPDKSSAEDSQSAAPPRRARAQTFTFKQLIRMLHITEPAYIVCCLLGKRYPSNEDDFRRMRLHLTDPTWKKPASLKIGVTPAAKGGHSVKDTDDRGVVSSGGSEGEAEVEGESRPNHSELPFCVFDARRAGQRMHLPVPETWETLLSKEGNTGRVWDALISANAVPYMALLRNLRNILTRLCSAASHKRVLEKLVDEQQVAASQQLPYRFCSAHLAVQQVGALLEFLDMLRAMPREVRSKKQRAASAGSHDGGGGDRRDLVAVASEPSAGAIAKAVVEAAKSFEHPMVPRAYLHRCVMQYCAALDSAASTAARLNAIPMKGTSIAIICVTSALFEPMSAMGAAAATPVSIQRKVDVTALLVAMLMRSCEQCVVLLYCYDEYVVFRESDPGEAKAMMQGRYDGEESDSSGDTGSSRSSGRNDAHDDGADEGELEAVLSPFHRASAAASQKAASGMMSLAGALAARCSSLLARKREEVGADVVATSFAMFENAAGAQFPYAFLDEIIERNMRIESLLVFDEGVHRTYANMNRNAPAFGDLPTYLSRLRRTCSPDLLYVGVNLKASIPPPAERAAQVSETMDAPVTASGAGAPARRRQRQTPASARKGGVKAALHNEEVKLRFDHHNDILLTGFSDAILRLVAVRTGGGPLAVIERAAETYHVSRLSARISQAAWAERAKALKVLAALREDQQLLIGGGSPETPHAADGLTFKGCMNSVAQSSTTTATHMQNSSSLSTRRSLVADATTAPAAVLPYFGADGKAVSATSWDWHCSSGSSDRRLQWLASSFAGLSSTSSASTASSAYDAEVPSKVRAALPSIRRLLAKPSFSGDEVAVATASASGAKSSRGAAVDPAGHSVAGEVRESEPAWLAAEGKSVSPIFHPQPFISIVKLLSMSSTQGASTVAPAAGDTASAAASAAAGRREQKRANDTRLHAQAAQLPQGRSTGSAATTVSSSAGAAAVAAPTVAPKTEEAESVAPQRLHDQASFLPTRQATTVVRRLITSYRLCRFFISSTFLDMNNERNAITLDIFPRLRRWAAEAGLKVTLLEVDLRWGIPALATRRNLSTSVCLNEVSRCSPFFVGVIGARYGSCPPAPLQLVVDEDVDAEDYAWMQELSDPHVSVTELEMRHAMYNAKRRLGGDEAPFSTLFFARDSSHLLSTFGPGESACRAVYEPDSATAAEAIERLKQRIAESGFKLLSYQADYIGPAKALLPGTRRCGSGGAPLLVGGATRSSVMRSGTRAMMEDDLGRWAVRNRHGFGSGVGEAASPSTGRPGGSSGSASEADSLSSFAKACITDSEEHKKLTSTDVAIDMTDFCEQVFHALQGAICRLCGVLSTPDDSASEKQQQQHADARVPDGDGTEKKADARVRSSRARPATASTSGVLGAEAPDMYEMLMVAQSEFARKLSDLYAAPHGLLERLSSFALNGTLGLTDDSDAPSSTGAEGQRSSSAHDSKHRGYASLAPSSQDAHDSRPLRGSSLLPQQQQQQLGIQAASGGDDTSSILLLEGCDGDGKSSALAALTVRVLTPMLKASALETSPRFLFYSTQAEDNSVRGLLLFLAKSLRVFFQLYGEVSVNDTNSVEELLLVLDQVYAAVHHRFQTSCGGAGRINDAEGRRGESGDRCAAGRASSGAGHAALVVMLDGLDKSSEAAELVSLLGTILHPLATQHIRFIVSACPRSSLARALRTRTPPARVLSVPLLSERERAELVRLHLANYGKLLEESFTADDLKNLLRKSGTGRPSYLISAITHLRLFSTFDTLREDIRALPASRAALHVQLFHHLQLRFDPDTCRVVLSILLLRQPVGGVLEFNLYRLVSNVAAASRLVTLLRGICLDSHHGRLLIKSSTFVDAIAHMCFRFASDYQCAQERVLLAELCYQPIDVSLDDQEVKAGLRQVTESIRRSAVDPLTRRTFVPERYAPRELLGVLQGSVQACRLDVIAALVCYLPFLECLLVNRRMLSQLVGLLSSVVSAASSASSLAPSASGAAGVTRSEEDADTEDIGGVRPLASYRALAFQWRHYRSEVRRLSGVLDILQKNYDVLLRQPGLLRQCVWNTVGPAACISAYDAASTARLQQAVQLMATSRDTASYEVPAPSSGECPQTEDGASHTPAARSSNMPAPSALSTMWVHWLNARQHGGEGCVMRATASPQSIRCMAMSLDGTEVALGGDDGVVRRVSANVDEQQPQQPQLASSESERVGGVGRGRVASTLRHESAVTSVLYVNPRAAGGPIAGTKGSGASATVSAPTGAVQLLVSGCARGLLYVWSLEDNSLLQRGTGHLRAISGLVSHPLEPTVLCSCGHDTFVMLWGIGSAEAPSRLRSEIQASLALRMPKHPAGSEERLRQGARVNVNGQSRVVGGGAGSATVRQDKSASSTGIRGQQTLFKASLMPFHTERQHHTAVAAVAFHRSGDIFASGSWDGTLVLHNTRELRTPSPVITPELKVPLEPPKPTRATGRRRRRGKLVWRTRHGPEHRQVMFQSTTFALGSSVRAAVFSNSLAVTCVVGCHNGTVVVVDHASAAVVARWTSLHAAPVTRLTASLDGRCMASADEHGVVRLTHTGITGSVFATLNGHNGAVTGLCFRPPRASHGENFAAGTDPLHAPAAVLLTAGEDCTLQGWRVDSSGTGGFATETTMPRRRLSAAHSTAVTAVASSRDGQLLVTGSADGTALVFRVPEEDDDVIVCKGVVGAATGGNFADAAALNLSKASGRKVMTASSTARPLKPAFTLRHDDCRITRICLAMRDSRIVVGVVFGLVYVWSSSPGLNQVEGRLLLRVRVPEHGLYPVVSLGVVERSGAAAMADDRGQGEAGKGGVAQQTQGAETPPLGYRRTPSSAAAAAILASPPAEKKEESSALVTAICANGDVAVFKLLGDAASLVMAAAQARRRQRQRSHQHHSSFSATNFPDNAVSQGDIISYASSADTLEGSAADAGVVVAALTSKSFGWAERVESGGEGVEAASRERITTTAANSPPDTREAGLPTVQEGWPHPIPPTTGGAARSPVGTPVAASASPLSQGVLPIAALGRRRQPLDRRAQRLQRLLSRCRVAEVELCSSYQLNLHRHRLLWANAADAEEITRVVWLSSQHPQPSRSGDMADAFQGKYGRLALVVAQRQLFLLFSNGRESALSRCLSARVSSHTPDGASLLASTTGAMPEERMAVGAPERGTSGSAASTEDGVVPLEAAAAEEFEVNLDYLLREGEHFTSASSAVEVAPVTASAATAEAIRWFAVAVTTSQGEVLLLRVQVPHVHGKHSDALGVTTAPSTDAEARHSAAASQHLSAYILPRTSVTLYRRLSLTGSITGPAAVEGDGAEAGTSGAALHRMTAAPRATCVELCTLPPALGASLDASATSLPSSAAATTAQRVVLLAGCTDGSTRVWLVATPAPVPCTRGGSPTGAEADEVSERPRVGGTRDDPIGCFFCTGSVSVVSGFLSCSVQRASGSGVVEPAPSSRWIVGDTLGNVYQLQLERDPPGDVAALLDKSRVMMGAVGGGARRGNAETRLTPHSAADINVKSWARLFQQPFAMMSNTPPASNAEALLTSCPSGSADEGDLAGGGKAADEIFGTLTWPGWSSHSPADWLAPVDVSSALPTLLKRDVSVTGARADAAREWRSVDDQPRTTALVSPSAGTAERTLRVGDEMQQLVAATPLRSTRVSPPFAPWSYLPDLPQVQRGSSTAFSVSRDGIAEGASGRGAGGPAHLLSLSSLGLTSLPAALPSFATGPRTSWSVSERHGADKDGGEAEVAQSFQKPLTSLVAGNRRQGARENSCAEGRLSCQAAVAEPPRRGAANVAVYCEVPPVASPAPPSSQSLPLNDQQKDLGNAADEDDYFAVLYEANPPASQSPCGSGAESRRAWLLHQHEVLKEAMRVQRYNRQARRALEAYQRRVAMAVGEL